MNKITEEIYAKSPVVLQNAIISMYGYYWKYRRLGVVFKKHLKQFKQRVAFTKMEWKEYQTLELRKLLIHAFTTVSFYTDKYKKAGFSLSDFQKFELSDISKLPYLEKEELRNFGKTTLLSAKRNKGKFYSSSGSTGTPVSIYFSKEVHQIWNAAYEVRVRNWAGVNHKMARGMIGGRKVVSDSEAKPPYYRFNAAEKQTYFSAYHISEKTTPNYVEGFIKNKVEYLVGYATSIFILADFIIKLDIKEVKLSAVLTSSEKLTLQMRKTIEKAFNCKVFDGYSGMEACGLISENKKGDLLFSPDTGIMEIIDSNGNHVSNGETGEVIATGLLNFDQPLIRYRIGDRVKLSDNQDNAMLKIDEIEGRIEDVLTTKDGKKIISLYKLFLDVPYLKRAQVIQNTYEDYKVKVVVENLFSEEHEKIIANRFFEKIGNDVNLKINRVKEIPKTSSGKYRLTISKLKHDQ